MKKIVLTAFLFSIFALNVISQTATVTVFSQDGEKFWVIMNGVKQNETPMTNVKVTGLSSPNYRLKIIFDDEKIAAIDKDIMTKNYDDVLCDQAYVIKKDKKGKHIMRLNSFEPTKAIATTVEPNQVAVPYTTVDRAEKPVQTQQTTQQKDPVQTQQTTNTTINTSKDNSSNVGINVKDPVTGESINMNMNISATGMDMNVKDPQGGNINMNTGIKDNTTHTSTTSTTTTTTTTTSGRYNTNQQPADKYPADKHPTESRPVDKHPIDKYPADKHPGDRQAEKPVYKLPGYNGPNGCDYPIATQDFDEAKKSISSKSFEDSKLSIAKQIASSNCLLTTQVKDIMALFSFEDSKLQFAKYAYQYTFDVGNYYKVNDAFTFEMSINELNEYIATQKK